MSNSLIWLVSVFPLFPNSFFFSFLLYFLKDFFNFIPQPLNFKIVCLYIFNFWKLFFISKCSLFIAFSFWIMDMLAYIWRYNCCCCLSFSSVCMCVGVPLSYWKPSLDIWSFLPVYSCLRLENYTDEKNSGRVGVTCPIWASQWNNFACFLGKT